MEAWRCGRMPHAPCRRFFTDRLSQTRFGHWAFGPNVSVRGGQVKRQLSESVRRILQRRQFVHRQPRVSAHGSTAGLDGTENRRHRGRGFAAGCAAIGSFRGCEFGVDTFRWRRRLRQLIEVGGPRRMAVPAGVPPSFGLAFDNPLGYAGDCDGWRRGVREGMGQRIAGPSRALHS